MGGRMRTASWSVLFTFAAACGTGGDFDVLGAAALPAEGCEVDPSRLATDAAVFDAAAAHGLRVPLVFENTTSSAITPRSFDFRFECVDAGLGDARVLQLGTSALPFCMDQRDDDSNYEGFGLVNATGARVAPGERGVAWVELVSPELGRRFGLHFAAAAEAARCLAAGNGYDLSNASCERYEELVRTEPAYRGPLNVFDLEVIASFAQFDGGYADELRAQQGDAPTELGPMFPMGVYGFLLAIDEDGDELTSAPAAHSVRICRQCGPFDANGERTPRPTSSCGS